MVKIIIKYFLSLFLTISYLIKDSESKHNRLIRVDGISPTCMPLSRCKEFHQMGSVISVDKSLPYMGSNYCCFQFRLPDESFFANNNHNPKFMGKIINTTILSGDDFITFYEGESFDLIKNVSSNHPDPYSTIFFKTPVVSVLIYKDRNYRSIYEIAITLYHEGDSPLCQTKEYRRCGTNTSICINEELTCDKFPHCPNESDEKFCEIGGENFAIYDQFTVMIICGLLAGAGLLTGFLIFSVNFCNKNQFSFSKSFLKICGNRKEPKIMEILNDENVWLNEKDVE